MSNSGAQLSQCECVRVCVALFAKLHVRIDGIWIFALVCLFCVLWMGGGVRVINNHITGHKCLPFNQSHRSLCLSIATNFNLLITNSTWLGRRWTGYKFNFIICKKSSCRVNNSRRPEWWMENSNSFVSLQVTTREFQMIYLVTLGMTRSCRFWLLLCVISLVMRFYALIVFIALCRFRSEDVTHFSDDGDSKSIDVQIAST